MMWCGHMLGVLAPAHDWAPRRGPVLRSCARRAVAAARPATQAATRRQVTADTVAGFYYGREDVMVTLLPRRRA